VAFTRRVQRSSRPHVDARVRHFRRIDRFGMTACHPCRKDHIPRRPCRRRRNLRNRADADKACQRFMAPYTQCCAHCLVLTAFPAQHDGAVAHGMSREQQIAQRRAGTEPLLVHRHQHVVLRADDESQHHRRMCCVLTSACEIFVRRHRVSAPLLRFENVRQLRSLRVGELHESPGQ